MKLRWFGRIVFVSVIAGCTTPDVGQEMKVFSGAVSDISKAYKSTLSIDDNTIREARIDALVSNRTNLVHLSDACSSVGSLDSRVSITQCSLEQDGITVPEETKGRAAMQLEMIAEYVSALEALANSNGDSDIQNATAVAFASVDNLAKAAPDTGLSEFAKSLTKQREGIAAAAGFLAKQYKYRQLRLVVDQADAAIQRLAIHLVDTAVAAGEQSIADSFLELNGKQAAMLAARTSDNATYREAVIEFYDAYDDFRKYGQSGLVPRVMQISTTHAALKNRLDSGASSEEIAEFIIALKTIEGKF